MMWLRYVYIGAQLLVEAAIYPREGVAARDGVTSEHNCSSKSRLVGAGGRGAVRSGKALTAWQR